MKYLALFLGLVSLVFACQQPTEQSDFEQALASITAGDITATVKTIGADKFLGRKPFGPGEELTVNYLVNRMQEMGLEPSNGGSYTQDVPMVEITMDRDEKLALKSINQNYNLTFVDDFVAWSRRITDEIILDEAEMIFAGYGIVAPEYNHDDYKGLDVTDKIVVVLVNDPGFDTGDSTFFKGQTMTYYGRWTYKYEEAARQGAAGCLIIHRDKGAGYPWSVVVSGARGSDLYLQAEDNYMSRCAVEGWLTTDAARRIFENAGVDFALTNDAAKPDFEPVSLNTKLSYSMRSKQVFKESKNVLGYLPGSERPDEVIIYSAHWDHFGVGTPIDGDSIYNGAVDNGTSIAWAFDIAEAFIQLENRPQRSVMFFFPTAEESGLLGSQYYAENPAFLLQRTVANINNDLMLPYGKMKDVMVTGYGQSELDNYVEEAAKLENRYVLPDPNPHTGMYFRSDHFSFAKVGVPSLFVRGNCDHAELGKEWMAQKEQEWLANNYHKPADQYEDWWDLTGVTDDARLAFRIGYKLSRESTFPQWSQASEFRAVRQKSLVE